MELGLRDRVAIIGGSSRGLGRAIAQAFIREGANVTICGRTEADLRRTEIDLSRESSQQHVLAVPADLTDARDIRRVVRDTVGRFGQLNILITHMGYQPSAPPSELSDDAILAALGLDFLSAVRFAREAVPYMKQQHWGRILNLIPQPLPGAPGADRRAAGETALADSGQTALLGYSKGLANELAPFNITVNNLIHGPILTGALAAQLEQRHQNGEAPPDELARQTAAQAGIPAGRLGRPDEVGDLTTYICSDRASYLTGASITLDGGKQQEIR